MVKLGLNDLNNLKTFDIAPEPTHRKLGWKPNIVMLDDKNKRLIIVCYLSSSGGSDYSLNEKVLIDGVEAINDGRRVVGYVALAEERTEVPEQHKFIAWDAVHNMWKRLRAVPTLEGTKFPGSRFWWIGTDMYPVVNAPAVKRRSTATSM